VNPDDTVPPAADDTLPDLGAYEIGEDELVFVLDAPALDED
jgi:hypothetical protein